jgi:IclR family transcriptional regulator, pca regulon regulatory protein
VRYRPVLVPGGVRGMGETVQSVERAFAILEAFDEQHPSRTAAEIAGVVGLARPTTYRMLQTLRQLGYVRHVGGRFEVTPRVLRLGAGYLGRESLAARAQASLDRLSEQCGEHVAIGMLDGDDVITLAASSSPHSRLLSIAVQPGQRLPADRTSLGRVLLAARNDRSIDDAAEIRAQGYVLSDGLYETGLRSLGVPICDHRGDVVASLAVAVNAARVSVDQLRTEFLPALRSTAAAIGALA